MPSSKSSRNPSWGSTSRACQIPYQYRTSSTPVSHGRQTRDCGLARGLRRMPQLCQARCVYGFYRDEADTLRKDIGYLDYIYQCKGCLTCIQNCTKGILSRVVNPRIQAPRRLLLYPRDNPLHLVSGRSRRHSCFRSRLRRTFQRPRIRLHVDRHVRDRAPHARRHSWTRIHQHQRGHWLQALASCPQ